MQARRYLILVIAGVVALVATVRGCSGPTQRDRIAEAVPEFSCAQLYVKTSSASYDWSLRQRRTSSALTMPSECRARLERILAVSDFVEEACGLRGRCWSRRVGNDRYRFEFAKQYVRFAYSHHES